jgi:nucleotide-binding universal stress UspA family protein
VLVPLDGSRLAEAAIDAVEHLGGAAARPLILLSVVAAVNPAPLLRDDTAPRRTLQARVERARGYLERVRRRLARRRIRAQIEVRSGDPAAEILACARTTGVAAIAMSTHGRRGLRRVLLGSVAESVVRRAPLPVLLVRGART